jgi:hypothetical protein
VSRLSDLKIKEMCTLRYNLTLLTCNASARYCAPISPILFDSRFNVVNVCDQPVRYT